MDEGRATLTIYITPEIHRLVLAQAAQEERSQSAVIRRALRAYYQLDNQGAAQPI